ncbi:MAG: endonuclease III domain-containing protein [Mariprofundus sp.]|nr:endonuclease III domain-containing protein [Mariprofundus sp.]
MKKITATDVYQRLFSTYGAQHWWPADTPFEVMVGAVLTQNCTWANAETALNNLKTHDMLHCESIATSNQQHLAEIIRASGTFQQKARYLQQLALFYYKSGGHAELIKQPLKLLRKQLLGIYGIGPETADSILLYALDKPSFVIDAYTKRLFVRLKHFNHQFDYDSMQNYFEQRLPHDVALFKEFHALIVSHGKRYCQTKPLCSQCPLAACCPTA